MRTASEWLVVPLLVLPVIAAAGLALWARAEYRRALDAYRHAGTDEAARWLQEGSGHAALIPSRFRADTQTPTTSGGEGFVAADHPVGSLRVWFAAPNVAAQPDWTFTDVFPVGLPAAALASPQVRLQVETGVPPGNIEQADETSALFAALLGTPDLEGLRKAPLPTATKRFLLLRWLSAAEAGVDRGALASALALVETVRAFERGVAGQGLPLAPGGYHLAGMHVLVCGDGAPIRVFAAGSDPPLSLIYTEYGPPDEVAALSWEFPSQESQDAGDEVLWSGVLSTPLAGQWTFRTKYGANAWWRMPRVRRWLGPVVVLLLAFLLLPVVLLVSMRRRRRLDEARVRFLNELAHDVRTPLTSLRIHADLLRTKPAADEVKRDRYLERLSRESALLSALLDNLLDLSRLEIDRRPLEPQTVDVPAAVGAAVEGFAARYPARRVDVEVGGGDDTTCRADPIALARCLGNLLDNAGKFTQPGTPIRVSWTRGAGEVAIVVEDEGPGVPRADRQKVFERYERGRSAAELGAPGTGIGLAVVRELVRGMGGRATLRPSDVGAAFEIRLPGGA